MPSIYDYGAYKPYLSELLNKKRGARAELAEKLCCQSGFISQVLNGPSHFSLEHAVRINRFLKHSGEEEHFFLLLVQKDRAGTGELREYFQKQIDAIQRRRARIKSRLQVESGLKSEDHATYYSHWYYAAIHVLVSIPTIRSRQDIERKLKLPPETVAKAVEFLSEKGLIQAGPGGELNITRARVHLDSYSPSISRHHTNWRLEAIRSIQNGGSSDNLHYSSAITCSGEAARKIRKILMKALEDIEPVFIASPEEELFSLSMDFFRYPDY